MMPCLKQHGTLSANEDSDAKARNVYTLVGQVNSKDVSDPVMGEDKWRGREKEEEEAERERGGREGGSEGRVEGRRE